MYVFSPEDGYTARRSAAVGSAGGPAGAIAVGGRHPAERQGSAAERAEPSAGARCRMQSSGVSLELQEERELHGDAVRL